MQSITFKAHLTDELWSNMKIWKYENMKIWKHENMKTWKHAVSHYKSFIQMIFHVLFFSFFFSPRNAWGADTWYLPDTGALTVTNFFFLFFKRRWLRQATNEITRKKNGLWQSVFLYIVVVFAIIHFFDLSCLFDWVNRYKKSGNNIDHAC